VSRSGYSDDCDDQWALIRWRGAVTQSIRGARGQKFLRELLEQLDAMPEKRLIPNSFAASGAYCTLGVAASARGVEMPDVDGDDFDCYDTTCRDLAATKLDIAPALAAEIMFLNDEGCWQYSGETPEQRWARMRAWVASQVEAARA
jgi:hypothetical protein